MYELFTKNGNKLNDASNVVQEMVAPSGVRPTAYNSREVLENLADSMLRVADTANNIPERLYDLPTRWHERTTRSKWYNKGFREG